MNELRPLPVSCQDLLSGFSSSLAEERTHLLHKCLIYQPDWDQSESVWLCPALESKPLVVEISMSAGWHLPYLKQKAGVEHGFDEKSLQGYRCPKRATLRA